MCLAGLVAGAAAGAASGGGHLDHYGAGLRRSMVFFDARGARLAHGLACVNKQGLATAI